MRPDCRRSIFTMTYRDRVDRAAASNPLSQESVAPNTGLPLQDRKISPTKYPSFPKRSAVASEQTTPHNTAHKISPHRPPLGSQAPTTTA